MVNKFPHYESHYWYKQLVEAHGEELACTMIEDAIQQVDADFEAGHGDQLWEVCHWESTNYPMEWVVAANLCT